MTDVNSSKEDVLEQPCNVCNYPIKVFRESDGMWGTEPCANCKVLQVKLIDEVDKIASQKTPPVMTEDSRSTIKFKEFQLWFCGFQAAVPEEGAPTPEGWKNLCDMLGRVEVS